MRDASPFQYHVGQLYCDAVPVSRIVAELGTPLYLYSAARLRGNYRRLAGAFAPLNPRICYSVKANSNLAILRLLAEEGSAFDIVSGGELYRTLRAGIPPERIVFAGVGKTRAELEFAVQSRVGWFNVEAPGEAERLNDVASARGKVVSVALRLRPGVEVGGHPYISTGGASSKFGMSPDEGVDLIRRAAAFPHLWLRGVHIHVGSQLPNPAGLLAAIDVALDFIDTAGLGQTTRARGVVPVLDIGGGFPIPYRDDESVASIDEFARLIVSRLRPLAALLEFAIEPGRYLAADAGALILTVQCRKEVDGNCVLVVDAGMNALLRPALYDAYHRILPLISPLSSDLLFPTSIVGPICESADVLARDRTLPPLAVGEGLAVLDAGAYGFSMASNYNSQPRPAEVLVDGEAVRLIRRRETYAELIAAES
jgi:diaminopimelate decarboxylase